MRLRKKKWQYTTEYLSHDDNRRLRNKLNEVGAENWELVLLLKSGYGIFKRPR